jgi:hypothetical protein
MPDLFFPNLLLIGAMKCGTSSLAADLGKFAGVYLPATKEPHYLMQTDCSHVERGQLYRSLYRNAGNATYRLDASTGYTRPSHSTRIAKLAAQTLSDPKILFIVRDPIARAKSHLKHMLRVEPNRGNTIAALEESNHLVLYGCYWDMVKPWFESFATEQIKIVVFEEFISDRWSVLATIAEFLKLDPLEEIDDEEIYNQFEGAFAVNTIFQRRLYKMIQFSGYKNLISPLISKSVKQVCKRLIFDQSNSQDDYEELFKRLLKKGAFEKWKEQAELLQRNTGISTVAWKL